MSVGSYEVETVIAQQNVESWKCMLKDVFLKYMKLQNIMEEYAITCEVQTRKRTIHSSKCVYDF
jgi:hypothetical protein